MMKTLILTFAILALTQYNKGFSAIVYTDINDLTLTAGGPINIDFDNDGTPEFTFQDQGFGGTVEPGIFFNSANEHLTTVSAAEWDVLNGIAYNTTIDANSGWFDQGDAYIDPFWGNTPFPVTDTYLGASFNIGGNPHFGWILVNWDANGTFIVKSYAYEDNSNIAINAGDTGTVANVLVTNINLSTATGDTIVNENNTLQLLANVLPTNATNDQITWSVLNGSGSGTIDQNGLFTGTSTGTVTIVATANDGSGTTSQITITITADDITNGGNTGIGQPQITPPNNDPNTSEPDTDAILYVPSVFTPNSGAYNNTLQVHTQNIDVFKMIIYNRWGEIVYISHDPNVAWDGTYANQSNPNEVYVWRINYTDSNGSKSEAIGQLLVLK